ncbi:MAG TPA: hypothetical protein VMF88_02130 [Bacteroidota bacterium]|nr:hypothetical protein [Bacteroidota bacterium]
MTIAVIGIAYCVIILGLTRLVHVLREQESQLREKLHGTSEEMISVRTNSEVGI